VLSYQWLRDGAAIGGATAPTYTLGDADVGKQVSVQVSYTDGHGVRESLTSAPGAPVANVEDAPQLAAFDAVTINESLAGGNTIALAQGSDADSGDPLSYSLADDAGGRFAIDVQTGRIYVAEGARLDARALPSLDLVVRVSDAQGLGAEQTLHLTVAASARGADVPSAPPVQDRELPREGPVQMPSPVAPAREAIQGTPGEPVAQRHAEPAEFAGHAEAEPAPDADHTVPGNAARGARGAAGQAVTHSVTFDLTRATLQGPVDAAANTFGSLAELIARAWSVGSRSSDQNAWSDATAAPGANPGDPSANNTFLGGLLAPTRVASVTVTAGFVWWLTRGGGLLASMLMGVPAWRHIDLLPVMAPPDEDEDDESAIPDDEQSVDGLFARDGPTSPDRRGKA
jgi:hypothetical protein